MKTSFLIAIIALISSVSFGQVQIQQIDVGPLIQQRDSLKQELNSLRQNCGVQPIPSGNPTLNGVPVIQQVTVTNVQYEIQILQLELDKLNSSCNPAKAVKSVTVFTDVHSQDLNSMLAWIAFDQGAATIWNSSQCRAHGYSTASGTFCVHAEYPESP